MAENSKHKLSFSLLKIEMIPKHFSLFLSRRYIFIINWWLKLGWTLWAVWRFSLCWVRNHRGHLIIPELTAKSAIQDGYKRSDHQPVLTALHCGCDTISWETLETISRASSINFYESCLVTQGTKNSWLPWTFRGPTSDFRFSGHQN